MLNSKLKVYKGKSFGNWIFFGIWCLALGIYTNCYALNLDKVRFYFLSGDYDSCINEGEKILAQAKEDKELDRLYYFLALSYLKQENYLRASDIFEIILSEYKNSVFIEEARLGLGDAYFLKGDYENAKRNYQEILSNYPRSKMLAGAYYRLAQLEFKIGNSEKGAEYLDKLKKDFPLSPEARLNKESSILGDNYYSVQVGSFANKNNAANFTQTLIQKGYPAYLEESESSGSAVFRVRVGKFPQRKQAQDLQEKLVQEGYPTKICP